MLMLIMIKSSLDTMLKLLEVSPTSSKKLTMPSHYVNRKPEDRFSYNVANMMKRWTRQSQRSGSWSRKGVYLMINLALAQEN